MGENDEAPYRIYENMSDALNKNLISEVSCNRLFKIGTDIYSYINVSSISRKNVKKEDEQKENYKCLFAILCTSES